MGVDIVYLDPPYNNRQYSANYSLLNYIVLYDSQVAIKGKSGIIEDWNRSKFCQKKNVEEEFEKLIVGLKTRYLLLSYNNEGMLSPEKIREILAKKGKTKMHILDYNKFQSQKGKQRTKGVFVQGRAPGIRPHGRRTD